MTWQERENDLHNRDNLFSQVWYMWYFGDTEKKKIQQKINYDNCFILNKKAI